ncbi:putative hydrolase of the HAD superfamily [Agromyces hippuratus]|uniref:Putative hydrolase of the HAD superfamily n=1 Tax=Agromyces hippuratus TaxID=286438 RepID=A0A852WZN7_9MICO|nr:HAD family hydrolase [Agromyces hippuratus]NYG20574.1 putative hydrolase of the HAD superfamily [Agromyces hippuratus]
MTASPRSDSPAPVILFDLDDTLMAHRAAVRAGIALHMRELAYEGDVAAASGLWHDLEEEHYHSYLAGRLTFEGQRRARARDFAIAHGDELDELAAGAWFDRYFERYRESWSLHDDALPALDALVQVLPDARFGIITNGELDFQLAKLERLGIRDRFEHVIASGDVGVTKPDAEIFRIALERFATDVPVHAAAYIGDRLETDAIGAADAGLIGVWLNRNGGSQMPSTEASAVLEITSLAELPALLTSRLAG